MPTILSALNTALHEAFSVDDRVYMIGEDILDPYGGAFKVTQALSSTYPERVITTPISEAGITGLAAGMALRGLRPVVEIMFGDFITLAADQVINHAAKFRWMYNDHVRVPLVIRTPMGGRRGYGPTHSQTLEKHFLGVPGLRVLAPCPFGDPGKLLMDAILLDNDPVLFIENKLLYNTNIRTNENQPDFVIKPSISGPPSSPPSPVSPTYAPAYTLTIRHAPPPTLTIAAYGYMAEVARQAALKLAYEHEIFTELVVFTQLSPFDLAALVQPVRATNSLLVLEEGGLTLGWGAEVVARIVEQQPAHELHLRRLAAHVLPVPASKPLEDVVLPGVERIIQTVQEMV